MRALIATERSELNIVFQRFDFAVTDIQDTSELQVESLRGFSFALFDSSRAHGERVAQLKRHFPSLCVIILLPDHQMFSPHAGYFISMGVDYVLPENVQDTYFEACIEGWIVRRRALDDMKEYVLRHKDTGWTLKFKMESSEVFFTVNGLVKKAQMSTC